MKRLIVALSLVIILGGCAGTSSTVSDLSADQPTVAETTAGPVKSTLAARIKAGEEYLWASYVKIKALIGAEAAPAKRLFADAWDLSAKIKGGASVSDILDAYHTARADVTACVEAANVAK